MVTTMASMPPKIKQLSAAEKRTDKGRFALKLRALLAERGWDHRELASRVDRGEASVRSWLRGDVIPDFAAIKAVGEALDVPGHPFPDYRMVLPDPR